MLEYDFPTREELWRYEGDPARPETTFFSGTSSTAERLTNGNTLIVATESGRAIEVTADGSGNWSAGPLDLSGNADGAYQISAVVIDAAEIGHREYLVAARVGQDRAVPVHEFVQAAMLADHPGSRPQHQVKGVTKDNLGTGIQ